MGVRSLSVALSLTGERTVLSWGAGEGPELDCGGASLAEDSGEVSEGFARASGALKLGSSSIVVVADCGSLGPSWASEKWSSTEEEVSSKRAWVSFRRFC